MSLRCFMQEQAPVPGSAAQPVRYPACEWVGDAGEVDLHHPLNRFVCAWLTSDVDTVERCQEVLDVLAQVASGQCTHWALDGDAFNVDVQAHSLQFNFSHVGPNDQAWWNLPEGCLAMHPVHESLSAWCRYLQTEPQ
mgnify:CR=1 FL=1